MTQLINTTIQIIEPLKRSIYCSLAYIDFKKENYKEGPKFKVVDHVRISKYKNAFANISVPNWSEEFFEIEKAKNTVSWTYVISDLNGEKTLGTFYKKELQKANQKEFRAEKYYREKAINYEVNGKAMIVLFIVGLIIKTLYKCMNTFEH